MPRFIITGPRNNGLPTLYYVSQSGLATTNAERAAVWTSPKDAREELEYFQFKGLPAYRWRIEQLPPRLPIAAAVLKAQPVEAIAAGSCEHCPADGSGCIVCTPSAEEQRRQAIAKNAETVAFIYHCAELGSR